MRPLPGGPELGRFRIPGEPRLTAGAQADLRLEYEVGPAGLPAGSRLRVGLPNTGWDKPVVPQQRYWDEIVSGSARRLAPFHPVNTTATLTNGGAARFTLDTMERMLIPDEDPAVAYWRWWITLTVEEQDLPPGAVLEIFYGDRSFGVDTRIQTFVEPRINVNAFLERPGQPFVELPGSPFYLDIVAGPASRVNVVRPSVQTPDARPARLSLTDECQCIPEDGEHSLTAGGQAVVCRPGLAVEVSAPPLQPLTVSGPDGRPWGHANPSIPPAGDGLQLFWGDLHAQSEHHVMHSQKLDFRQAGWSKGISCGTLDECYRYAREVSMLDFMALTDQGACLTGAWELCQEKVREYHEPGRFVTFRGYEAGSPLGHRNVIYSSDGIDAPLDAKRFNTFHPHVVFEHYRGRNDVIIIPHHVKTWTDWQYHDPELEPLMEIYSCWGQSESPGLDLWNKGQTLGAGAWEALRRGYRLGMMASSDNHVGMPGRSYPGDRQIHTPFPGGLCAVWSEELTRDSLFRALRARRCYGTTGARIIVRFSLGAAPMGSVTGLGSLPLRIEIHGTAPIASVEVVRNLETWRLLRGQAESPVFQEELACNETAPAFFYLRIRQQDGQRAWTSPIWME